MIEQSIMKGTSRTYNSAYNHYANFCNQYQLPLWPKDKQQQELQLLYWHAIRLEQVQSNTLVSQYHGVKHAAALAGHLIDAAQCSCYTDRDSHSQPHLEQKHKM